MGFVVIGDVVMSYRIVKLTHGAQRRKGQGSHKHSYLVIKFICW